MILSEFSLLINFPQLSYNLTLEQVRISFAPSILGESIIPLSIEINQNQL